MTAKEAIEILQGKDGSKDEMTNVLIKVLMKQVPIKPDFEGDGFSNGELVYDTWICPNCRKKYEVEFDDYDYCPNCGQKIDLE